MMLSAEIKEEPREETNQKQETVRPKQLAMSYLQMQQIYNPMLQSMIQTNQSDFRHFMALQEQTGQQGKPGVGLTTLSEKQITAEKPLENKSVENQSNDASVVDESTSQEKDSERIKKNRTVSPKKPPKREVRAKRLLPKRLQAPKSQTVVQKRPKPLCTKAKVLGKPFQTHDEMTCFVCNIFCGHVDVLEEHFKGDKNVCRVCTRTFTVHAELETHFTSHKPSTCNSCGAVNYCKADYYKHLRENPACNVFDTDLKCDLCDKTFTRKRTLRIHKIQHHTNNEAKYKCIVCHKPFNLLWMLNLHLTKTHFVSEHIECQICHRIFLGVDSLKNHMNIKHFTGSEQAKSFQCTICCQNFNKESSLMSHMKHRHDKTESLCEDCGMSVFGYKAMQEHKRMYHPKDNETFICEFCHQTFDEYKPYRQHRKSYHHKKPEPQFCEICGKGFKNLSTLKHHYAVHKDERKWECEICKATFKQKVALTTHGRVHSDVKQYVCDNCGESFRWKQTFDKHIKLCSGSHTNM